MVVRTPPKMVGAARRGVDMITEVDFDGDGFAESLREALENMSRDLNDSPVEELVYKYVASSITVGWVFQMLGKGFDKSPDGRDLLWVLKQAETARLDATDGLAAKGETTNSNWSLIRRFAEGWARFAEAVANIPMPQMYHLIPSSFGLDHLVDPRIPPEWERDEDDEPAEED